MYHKVFPTSLVVWMLERSYNYGGNNHLNKIFLFPCMPIHFLPSHDPVILNLYACRRKHIFTQCTELHKYLRCVA
jgi:hypothetical protein